MSKPMKHKDGKSTAPSKEFRDNWDRIFSKTCNACGKECSNDELKKVSITHKACKINQVCKECYERLKSKDEKL